MDDNLNQVKTNRDSAAAKKVGEIQCDKLNETKHNLEELGIGEQQIKKLFEYVQKIQPHRQTDCDNVLDLTIVLLGRTGSGKSSTGNSLIGVEDLFETDMGGISVSQKTVAYEKLIELEGVKIRLTIIDTPGYFDQPEESEELKQLRDDYEKAQREENGDERRLKKEVHKRVQEERENQKAMLQHEVNKCIKLAPDEKIDAFFLIMDCNARFDVSVSTLNDIKEAFGGKHMFDYLFVVLTHADDLARHKKTEADYRTNRIHSDLRNYLNSLPGGENDRLLFIDNTLVFDEGKKELLAEKRREMLGAVLKNMARHGLPPYTSKNFVGEAIPRTRAALSDTFEKLKIDCNNVTNELNDDKEKYVEKATDKRAANVEYAGRTVNYLIVYPLSVAGVILAPVTFGASLGLEVAAGAIGLGVEVTIQGVAYSQRKKEKEMLTASTEKVKLFLLSADEYAKQMQQAELQLLQKRLNLWPSLVAEELEPEKFKSPFVPKEGVQKTQYASITVNGLMKALRGSVWAASMFGDEVVKIGSGALVTAVPIAGIVVGAITDAVSVAATVHAQSRKKESAERKFSDIRKPFDDALHKIQTKHTFLCDEIDTFMADPTNGCNCAICGNLWSDPVLCLENAHVAGCKKCVETRQSCPTCNAKWNATILAENEEKSCEMISKMQKSDASGKW